jgi:hypothetical protein
MVWSIAAAGLLLMAASITSQASELNPESLTAWEEYVQAQNARVEKHPGAGSFLWSDQSPDRIRRLHEGEILIAPVGENPKIVPHALIHHWVGAIFLPNTGVEDVVRVVRDYDNYKNFYAPNVIDSRLLHQTGADDTFSLRMLNKAVVAKFALDVEMQSSYAPLDKNRWYSVGHSTRILEIEEYGQAGQHELPSNIGHGFIWRLYNVSRFEQRDGGVYVEVEAVALSRDVPGGLRWLVNPVVRRVSKGSMLVSLQKTHEAVLASNELASRGATKDQGIREQPASANKALGTELGNGFVSRKTFRSSDKN